jgi:glycosyltransferase involved in cell wall biosynthesis
VQRPVVVHVVREWLRPSEGFVADTIRTTTATRAVVAYRDRLVNPATDAVEATAPTHRVRGSWSSRRARVELAAVAAARRAAVVHAHFGQPAALSWRVARRLAIPFAVALHGYDLLVESGQDSGMLSAVRAADLVVVPSRFLADAAADRGVPDEVIRVIPSGLDLAALPFRERAGPRPGAPARVTFAGRFVPKKGVLDAAEVMARAAREGVRVEGRFVGYGELEGALRRRLAELVAESGGAFTAEIVDGSASGAVRAALADTDVLLTASRVAAGGDAETLGLVNLEAHAMGVPVVTLASGGVGEAVSPRGGVLVADGPERIDALTHALVGVLRSPESWAAMGRAGRAHVAARFELGARTADLEEQWLALARSGRAAPPRQPAGLERRPAVSVVMVTYNRPRLLDAALSALEHQTRPADEVLVVDNGSTDETAALLADRVRAGRPAGLRVIAGPPSRSVAEARNRAVAAASGAIIAFTDDDCRPRPTWLEALIAGFAAGVGLVQGRTIADPQQDLAPLSRTQWTPAECGLYETCNIAYTRVALAVSGPAAPAGPFDLRFAAQTRALLGRRFGRYPFGEDTELGWRVKRSGAVSRFAAGAVVEHHVFPPDPPLLLRRAVLAAGFPLLVTRAPELRDAFLWHRYVLGQGRLAVWAALAGIGGAAALGQPAVVALAVPYGWRLLRPLQRGRRPRLKAAPVVAARDLVESAALLYGSARARRVVL